MTDDAKSGHVNPKTRIYDARGNGSGKISPTLTGDHQSRITDYTAIVLEIISEEGQDAEEKR